MLEGFQEMPVRPFDMDTMGVKTLRVVSGHNVRQRQRNFYFLVDVEMIILEVK
jgi:hypothetical protein